jgi:hypothetical protein
MSEHHQETDSDAYTEHDNLNAPGRSKHLKYVVLGIHPDSPPDVLDGQ